MAIICISEDPNLNQYENGELHSSGNWAPDLRHKDRGGKLDVEEYRAADTVPELTKTLHYLKPKMAHHMHVYMPRRGYVELPTRPEKEAPTEWAGVPSNYVIDTASGEKQQRLEFTETVEAVQKLLHTKLASRLEAVRGNSFD